MYIPGENDVIHLHSGFGHISMYVLYKEVLGNKINAEKFCYKFTHNNAKITVTENKTETSSPYGFHLDRDLTIKNRSHPPEYLHYNPLRRPRFMLRQIRNEFEAFYAFFDTLAVNFFDSKGKPEVDNLGNFKKLANLR